MAEWIFGDLPVEILDIVWEHVSPTVKYRCNRGLYSKYHKDFVKTIPARAYHSYVRDMVRNDYSFVVRHLLYEEYSRWGKITMYNYGGFVYDKYETFLRALCKTYQAGRTLAILDASTELVGPKRGKVKAYRKKRVLRSNREWTS